MTNQNNFNVTLAHKGFESCDLQTARQTNSWSHFERSPDNLSSIIALGVGQHDAASLLDETTRPQLHRSGTNGILLFLRAINLNPDSDPEDMVSLRFWCNGEKLVTVMNRKVQAVKFVLDKVLEEGSSLTSVNEVFQALIYQTMLRIERHVAKLTEQIESLEERLDNNKDVSQSEVSDLKRSTSRLWRFMHPQLDSLKKLAAVELDWFDNSLKYAFKEFVDTMSYYNEELSLISERCEILSSEISGKINAKVNRNLYIISIISVIFLPLSFITGLLGINVGGIPAANADNGFMLVMILMLVIFAIQVVLLKIFKWF